MTVEATVSRKRPILQYHSQTAYQVRPDESNAVLQASAYHRKDFDLAVKWFQPRTHTDIVMFILPASRKQTATLGELEKLPLELVNEICLKLDIGSLFRFRQANTRARQVLGALHEYCIVTTHAIDPLCALLRTGSASRVTLEDFYRLLCTRKCSLCGDGYGDLVYFPTWIRFCSRCLRNNVPEVRIATVNSIKRILRLSKKTLEQLPKLVTLPGVYTMDERQRSGRVSIVPVQSALSGYRKENAESEAKQAMINRLAKQPILAFMACCALPSYDPRTGQIENGVSCAGCQLASEDHISTGRGPWDDKIRDMVYSHNGYLKHFAQCEQAQLLWSETVEKVGIS